ncbi:DUF4012 domain-containing protein [Candidatus Dojkabacteria bacterium]|nr:DUF4012 domain-containing protein [Candidatus Dojkabacteria bacterium]
MKGLNNKRTTLVVYGAYPVSLDIITTLLSENGSVIVADIYNKDKHKLFRDIRNNLSFKFIVLDAISKLESVINKIDYIFVLLDQHIDGESVLKSEKYLEILNTLQATLEYAKSTKTKVAITFPLNTYPTESKAEGQYTIKDLYTNITKKINEVTEKNKFVKLIYTGELIGPGMNITVSTPFRDLLIDSIIEEKVSISGDGLESYSCIYTSDYVYGLVKSNFSGDSKNVLMSIKEKVSLLSFAYKVIEYNPVIQDIEFTKLIKTKKESFKPDLSLENTTIFDIRFNIDESIEKTVNYLYSVSEKKRIAKAPPLIARFQETPKEVDSIPKPVPTSVQSSEIEELTPIGKLLETLKRSTSPLRNLITSAKQSWNMFVNNPAKIALFTILSAVVALLFYFLVFPITSLFYNGYRYQKNIKSYAISLLGSDTTQNAETLKIIESSNTGLQRAWERLSWSKSISYITPAYNELDKLFLSIDHITTGISYWDKGATPIINYLSQLEIPQLIEYERINTSKEYSLELKEIENNSQYLVWSQEEFYKGTNIIKTVNTDVFPKILGQEVDKIKVLIDSNEKYIESSFSLLSSIPDLVGVDNRTTYIILLENPYELRAQGGWISGYGLLEFEHGQIKVLKFDNIYNLDGIIKNEGLFITPPKDFLYQDSTWLTSQVNWNLDHEEMSAELETMLKAMNVRQKIDGVITINMFLLADLLSITGPIEIDTINEPITSSNLLLQVVDYHNSFTPGADTKPDILSEIASEAYNALVTNNSISIVTILDFFKTQLNEKNIIISVDNPLISEKLSALSWNNSISNYSDGFYIYPSEWNYGGNKANAFLTRSIEVKLDTRSSILTGETQIEWRNLSVENIYPQGNYQASIRIQFPANTIVTNVSGSTSYNVINSATETTVYVDIDVGIQSTGSIKVNFSNAQSSYPKLYLVKQPGIYNTVYSVTIVSDGDTKKNSAEFNTDVVLEL